MAGWNDPSFYQGWKDPFLHSYRPWNKESRFRDGQGPGCGMLFVVLIVLAIAVAWIVFD
jgi:hypothetical protein